MKITVYGPGCNKCKQAEEVVRSTVAEAGADVEVEKVSEIREIVKAGVLTTPAVAVDGVVKLAGRVPTPDEVKAWLTG
ncbi:MAG TPA: thioredoxin family protein [Armatimonadota bacterium]|jgi:small redox-active disulfide protein 2